MFIASSGLTQSTFIAAVTAITVFVGGCATNPSEPTKKAVSEDSSTALYDLATGNELTELDFGEDWLASSSSPTSADNSVADVLASRSARALDQDPYWAVVLATYSGDNHEQAAATTLAHVRQLAPQLDSVRVHTTDNGSMVICGRYESADDERAKEGLEQVKRLGIGDRPLFARALLTVIAPPLTDMNRSPYSLHSARQRHPDVDPLYTLQIAVWSDFGSQELTAGEVRRRAQDMATGLRQQGREAYFHHHPERALSVVTVGLFDRRAIDPASGIPSFEVVELIKQFPAHMVNGEPLQEYVDMRRTGLGTQVQKPMLVEVPR